MSVSHEIKSHLAKLLATEDLVVEHKKVETACFNVHTRVLTLPMWEKAGNEVYDMLVAHEVGHALYTPDVNWIKDKKIPPQYVNIVEDVRIEKLMKRRYGGISKTFYFGYNYLADQDFFDINDEDVSSMSLADRVNLYFKIGNFVDIPFNKNEEYILSIIENCETFDDVLLASEKLHKHCGDVANQTPQEQSLEGSDDSEEKDGDSSSGGSSGATDGSLDSTESDESSTENSTEFKSLEDEESSMGGEFGSEVKTVDALEEALKQLSSMDGFENIYMEIPKVELNDVIVPNSAVHKTCDDYWSDPYEPELFEWVDSKFEEFKKSAQKEVSYLVKEFECRKAADSYARATVARTGVLDCSKLHTYKYNEDLFKKVTTLADGKNHGLVFVLDWSGSMQDVLLDTIKQLFNLVWFCNKVKIPFDVYAFTAEYPYMADQTKVKSVPYEKKEGLLYIGEWFSMMNLLTHKTKTKELENQMKNLFRLAYAFGRFHSVQYPVPRSMNLSGTPLNEAMMTLHQILPKFKKENKLQKVQCIVLTDGEGYPPKYHREIKRRWESEPFIGTGSVHNHCILRNRKTGHTYPMNVDWNKITDVFLEDLKQTFPDINFIGIRVLASRDAGAFIRTYCGYYGELHDKVMKDWKKTKSFTLKTSGYHSYFGLSATGLSNESKFDVSEDASKSEIKRSFIKSLKGKKVNKKILNEFINLIA